MYFRTKRAGGTGNVIHTAQRDDPREVSSATNKSNDHIFFEIGTGTMEQDTRKIRIDVNRFCRDVKQVLTLTKFHCTDDGQHFSFKDYTYRLHINILKISGRQFFFSFIRL